ncbi:MAG: DUF3313 domain-containing protein [Pseudomonas sp.]|uniref:DUF3313 domain-containing protein n=1 Tax=Pseudomonas sp. TaxID=306 RepID=UPI0033941A86
MKTTRLALSGVLAVVLLGGCSSNETPNQAQYSGFLSNYEGLAEHTTPAGNTVLRWVSPDFKLAKYDKVIFQPIRFYPAPQPTQQVSAQTLKDLLGYTNSRLSEALSRRLQLVGFSAIPGTLEFRGAITAVTASPQGIPLALVMAESRTSTGEREQNSELYLEAELVDAVSGKPMLRVVRKGMGTVLSDDRQTVTVDDLKSVINGLTLDVLSFD